MYNKDVPRATVCAVCLQVVDNAVAIINNPQSRVEDCFGW